MINRIILFFSFVFLTSLSLYGQRNYGQELIDILLEGKCIEARDFKKQYREYLPDNSDFVDIFYKYKMAIFLNKPDSAVIYLHQLVADYEDVLGLAKSGFYGEMLRIYFDMQQFDKGIALCDEIIAYLKRNPFNIEDSDFLNNEIKDTENWKSSFLEKKDNEPRIKVVRKDTEQGNQIKLYTDSTFIKFDAEYNGHQVKTWFDTGVSYHLVMEKTLADNIGVKYKHSKDSIIIMNNTPVRAIEGVVDSINLGNITLYNIPVNVFLEGFTAMIPDSLMNIPEKKELIEKEFSSSQILLGLPTMFLIGQFEFNWEDLLLILHNDRKDIISEPNIFIKGNRRLYMSVFINSVRYSGFLDTGASSFIDIDSDFYKKHKEIFTIDTVTQKTPLNFATATGVFQNIPYELVQDTKILFNDNIVPYKPKDVVILKSNDSIPTSGAIGAVFFRRVGSKVLFDFINMRIEVK